MREGKARQLASTRTGFRVTIKLGWPHDCSPLAPVGGFCLAAQWRDLHTELRWRGIMNDDRELEAAE
jgi:hypothetical protein